MDSPTGVTGLEQLRQILQTYKDHGLVWGRPGIAPFFHRPHVFYDVRVQVGVHSIFLKCSLWFSRDDIHRPVYKWVYEEQVPYKYDLRGTHIMPQDIWTAEIMYGRKP